MGLIVTLAYFLIGAIVGLITLKHMAESDPALTDTSFESQFLMGLLGVSCMVGWPLVFLAGVFIFLGQIFQKMV